MDKKAGLLIGLIVLVAVFGIIASTHYVLANNDSEKNSINSAISSDDEQENESENNNENPSLISSNDDVNDSDDENEDEIDDENKTKEHIEKIKEAIQERNRIKFGNKTSIACPINCTCTGVTVKCWLENGTREMTIYAKSGNIIFQVKGVNVSTNVTLYHHDGKVYGVSDDNKTISINYLPDNASKIAKERLRIRNENFSIQLREKIHNNIPKVVYNIEANKSGKFLGIFKLAMKEEMDIDPETGEVIEVSKPWWAFMVSEQDETLLGESCGTVTPGTNDECCQNKGYDYWNSTKEECDYN